MKRLKKLAFLVCVAALCLGVLSPIRAAGVVYLTAVNDSLLDLNAQTMPTWSAGVLYVPCSVFDGGNSAGVSFGLSSRYNKSSGTLGLYNLRGQMMIFDLNQNICYDGITEEPLIGKAIIRNGRPYVPLAVVCEFFGLSYTIIQITEGYVVRVRNSSAVLGDIQFISDARNLVTARLREYYQENQSTTPTPGVLPPTAGDLPQPPNQLPELPLESENDPSISVYLGIRCDQTDGLPQVLDTLDEWGKKAVFFFPAQELEREDDLIYRILGSGHSVGLLGQGATAAQTKQELEESAQTLEEVTYAWTGLAMVPSDQKGMLEEWVCWNETDSAIPQKGVGGNTYANRVVHAIERRGKTAYITLDGSTQTAKVLPALMRRLAEESYPILLPLETRL